MSPHQYEIYNIFDLKRKGEAERFAPFAGLENRMLLWHGSSVVNYAGIFTQGLRIAPPEAAVSGYVRVAAMLQLACASIFIILLVR